MQLLSVTKAAAIYREIKKDIINGKVKPGTHLVISKIADQYGVSDIPVREALKELNAEGLVETVPHVGSRVASISLDNFEDMLVMRECLEPFAAELAAKNIDEETVERLEQYNNTMKAALEKNDIESYHDANTRFHRLLIEASGNKIMAKAIFELMDSEQRMRMIFQLFPEILDVSNKEHGLILDLVKKRNGKALARLIYEHKKRAFDKMRAYLRQHVAQSN